jgi:hypothetical protein
VVCKIVCLCAGNLMLTRLSSIFRHVALRVPCGQLLQLSRVVLMAEFAFYVGFLMFGSNRNVLGKLAQGWPRS